MEHQGVQNTSTLPRKVTAMGTVGDMGKLFTVYEKNWTCPDCNQENYASRLRCFRCRKAKPQGEENYIMDPAISAMQAGQSSAWREAIDPTSYQVYYYNTTTGETQWERPAEMGAAPMATGWFGRGRTGSTAAQLFANLNKQYLSRPARKQKEFVDASKYHTEGTQEYNIWYGRYVGDSYDDTREKDPAPTRCVLTGDGGSTRADAASNRGDPSSSTLSRRDRRFFCLHFARGMCAKGSECLYYHRVPTPADDAACDELYDCFGRQRHSKHRDDMSGVGSFMKPCRTLFVGGLVKSSYEGGGGKALEDAVWKHFSEWGELENVNVVHRLSIAFPRYRLRTSAEFAKEAMNRQALDGGEVLSVRWAHDDPNPVAQEAIDKSNKDALVALMLSRGLHLDDVGFAYPADYVLPTVPGDDEQQQQQQQQLGGESSSGGDREGAIQVGQKRMRSAVSEALEGDSAVVAYPDTNAQYGDSVGLSPPSQQQEQHEERVAADVGAEVDGVVAAAVAGGDSSSGIVAHCSSIPHEGRGWVAHVDPSSGATFFHNAETGETSWGVSEVEGPAVEGSSEEDSDGDDEASSVASGGVCGDD